MNLTSMADLCGRYLNDPQFREQMRQDPVQAAESTGLTFDEEDRESIKQFDWGLAGEQELRERSNKGVSLTN